MVENKIILSYSGGTLSYNHVSQREDAYPYVHQRYTTSPNVPQEDENLSPCTPCAWLLWIITPGGKGGLTAVVACH